MARAIRSLLLLLLACGCGTSAVGSGPDGGDGSADAGAQPAGGLVFQFVTDPPLSQLTPTIFIDEVRISLHDVRAIGDAAPGDSRTFVPGLDLEWSPEDAPPPLVFAMAPPGIYSTLQARLGGHSSGGGGHHGPQGGPGGGGPGDEMAYRIRGHVVLSDGNTYNFEIEDDSSSPPISVPLGGITVEANAQASATLSLSLSSVAAIDWNSVPFHDGELKLQSGDPLTTQVTQALASGFSLVQ